MTKQTIEIEVPEGKKAVWKDGSIYFENIDSMKNIRTIDDAIQYLKDKNICGDILDSLRRLPTDSYEWKIAAYRAVVAAVTNNEQRHLITGECWYPSIEFCLPDKLKNCYGNTIIGRIKSEGKVFDVVGGYAHCGLSSGFGYFNSYDGVGGAWTVIGARSVGTEKAAKYISKQFGKLLFEVVYGGVNCDWKWVSIN